MQKMHYHIIKGIHGLLLRSITYLTVFVIGVAGYAIWDNQQVYRDAKDVLSELYQFKPKENENNGPDLAALKAINSDVCAWLTIDGTKIDAPVLQAKDNLYYMNRDIYKQYSLAGSLFLDYRNSADFSDAYSVVYGHHMADSLMFGDLDLFKDAEFFKAGHGATILLDHRVKKYNLLAVMEIPGSSVEIFHPELWEGDLTGFDGYLRANAKYIKEESLEKLRENPDHTEVVAFVTCSDNGTEVRTVVIVSRTTKKATPKKSGEKKKHKTKEELAKRDQMQHSVKTGDSIKELVLWTLVLWISFIGILLTIFWKKIHRK